MIYQVMCDGFLLLDTRIEEYKIINPKVKSSLNKVGEFTFSIYPNHRNFDKLKKMKSMITVYQNGNLIFKGRILDFEQGFHNEKQVICESELAFLIDSIQRPFAFTGTITEYLQMLIDNHNGQVQEDRQFALGKITVTDSNDYINRSDTQYSTTWDLINSGLIDTHGGYIVPRHEDGIMYIDYLTEKDFNLLNNQAVEFGKNLLSVVKTVKGADIATIIIPIGATPEGADYPITIKELEDDTESEIQKVEDYIFNQAEVDKYGKITKVVNFDDVTMASNLLTKAKEYYSSLRNDKVTITLNAADMAAINEDLNNFKLGTKIHVKSDYHALDDYYLIDSLDIELLKPSNNKLVVGKSYDTFTETSANNNKSIDGVVKTVTSNNESTNLKLAEMNQQLITSIEASVEELSIQVAENYYTKDDSDQLISSLNTEFTQTKDEFNFQFNQFYQDIEAVSSNTAAQFENISKYIRFVDGNIVLGEDGNELVLYIQNNRISFLENNVEVAYLSNNKLYVNDGEYINSLKLGKFAFMPRANGNLSFKKVVK
ncbi:phage tail protein [Listeria monocytogenes]